MKNSIEWIKAKDRIPEHTDELILYYDGNVFCAWFDSKMKLEGRVRRLEVLVEILLEENSILKAKFSNLASTSDIELYHEKMIKGWNAHPDGDFDKTFSGRMGCIVDTEYRDRHIFKKE